MNINIHFRKELSLPNICILEWARKKKEISYVFYKISYTTRTSLVFINRVASSLKGVEMCVGGRDLCDLRVNARIGGRKMMKNNKKNNSVRLISAVTKLVTYIHNAGAGARVFAYELNT